MTDQRHIGILMHSAEGALLCFRTAIGDGIERLGPHNHPTITMSGRAMHHAMKAWETADYPALRRIFADDAAALAAAGADFFVLPDNTAHIALEVPGEPFALPGLHIAEVAAEFAVSEGMKRIGILGTDWTMRGPVYPGAFGRRGLDWATPDKDMRARLHAIIFDELCLGIFEPDSVAVFERAIEELADRGCDAVALVCTEIPLIVGNRNSALPVIDSTRLLARAAVDVALGERALPEWRGGPL